MEANVNRFMHLVDTVTTDNYLLFSFVHFMSILCPIWSVAYIKSPMKEMFWEDEFEMEHFILILGAFELNHGINIPDEYVDYNLTIEEFIAKISTLPKMTNEEYKQHLDDFRQIRYDYYRGVSEGTYE